MEEQPGGTGSPAATSPRGEAQDGPDLIDYALLLWRRKWLVAICAVAGAALGAAHHFLATREYQATALVLPAQDSGGGMAAKLAGLAADLPIAIPGAESPSARYIDILKSRKVMDELIARFDLRKRYGSSTQDGARRLAKGHTRFEITKGELISVSVADEDPQKAAEMANYLVEILGKTDRQISVGKAGRQRRFLDTRLAEVEKDLKAAQGAWRAFQEKHRIVRVDEGLKATATVLAQLEAERTAKEIRLQVLETVYTKTNPEVEILRAEVKKLGEKLKELAAKGLRSSGDDGTGESRWLFPAIEKVPALALEQMDLERRLRVQAALYKLLVTQRETARMEEARENPEMQVISEAVAPDRPRGMGPVRKSGLAGLAGCVIAAVAVYFSWVIKSRRALRQPALPVPTDA